MKKTILTLIPILLIGSPALSGLGDAVQESSQSETLKVWCGKRKNNCRLSFDTNTLTVNGTDSITREQFRGYRCTEESFDPGFWALDYEYQTVCSVSYEENGQIKTGRFIANNINTRNRLRDAMATFCGPKCRKVGPSYKIE